MSYKLGSLQIHFLYFYKDFTHSLSSLLVLSLVDRRPGDIESITDIFFEDFKNFPQARELGEESARFVREEMEKTWGDSRMAVLPEDEAQKWILGVISIILLFLRTSATSPCKICKYFKDFCINTLKLFTNRTLSHSFEFLS